MSGNPSVEQARFTYLCELALDMCDSVLKPKGAFVIKVFQGEGSDEFFRNVKSAFEAIKMRKPGSSRARSREVYLVATGCKV